MSVYLDASILVSLFIDDSLTQRARSLVAGSGRFLIISDFMRAELASVVARYVRTGAVSPAEAAALFADFDSWSRAFDTAETTSADVRLGEVWLRRLDLNLRAPDAVHIAIAARLGASLATFDVRMAEAARALGVLVEPI
ncbi:MAG TPA: type II toxin-antitoxin system VapC family toxin [Phenylobacterium sp.]|nr:type II toxin-antitoxin system VapC family toxin [Phenylobacterium sp.]HQP19696.1 type II toxin-antitoxin system VapC family toxin [Phenylobacterium sp.]